MKNINIKALLSQLPNFDPTDSRYALYRHEGKVARGLLLKEIKSNDTVVILDFSEIDNLIGVFLDEFLVELSVVLAKKNGSILCITGLNSELEDSIIMVLCYRKMQKRQNVTILVKRNEGFDCLGHLPSRLRKVFSLVVTGQVKTATELAVMLKITIVHASTSFYLLNKARLLIRTVSIKSECLYEYSLPAF